MLRLSRQHTPKTCRNKSQRSLDALLEHVAQRSLDALLEHVAQRSLDALLGHVAQRSLDALLGHVAQRSLDALELPDGDVKIVMANSEGIARIDDLALHGNAKVSLLATMRVAALASAFSMSSNAGSSVIRCRCSSLVRSSTVFTFATC